MTGLSADLLDKHEEFRSQLKRDTTDIDRGDFWTERSPHFDAALTEDGFKNIGKYNYFPGIVGRDVEEDYPRKNEAWQAYCVAMSMLKINGFEEDVLVINSRKYFKSSVMCLANHYTLERLKSAGIKPEKYLEIGGGSGILAALLHQEHHCQVAIVDLPEMLSVSSAFLMYTFPNKRFLLSNEITIDTDLKGYDFILLTPKQAGFLPKDYFDLAINKASFMEMEQHEVDNYFKLIDSCLKSGGVFYCSNRAVKRTVFFDYPWNKQKNYRDVFYELNEFRRNFPNEFVDRCRVKGENGFFSESEQHSSFSDFKIYWKIRNILWRKTFQKKHPFLSKIRNKFFELFVGVTGKI